jgi:hypothetical protein
MIIPPRLCGDLTYLDCQSIHASWSVEVAALLIALRPYLPSSAVRYGA